MCTQLSNQDIFGLSIKKPFARGVSVFYCNVIILLLLFLQGYKQFKGTLLAKETPVYHEDASTEQTSKFVARNFREELNVRK